jgi:hypothetical protein
MMNWYSHEELHVVEQYDDQYVIIISYQYDINEYNAIDYRVETDILQ